MSAALRRLPPGVRYMAGAAFFFSVMSMLVKLAGSRLPTQEVVLGRSAVGLLLSWIALRRRRIPAFGRRRGLLFVRGLLGFGALSAFFYALTRLPLAEATVIQYTNPVFTGVIAAVVLDEAMSRADVLAVALSLVGVVLVARPQALFGGAATLDPIAVAVGLAGALLSAAAYVAVRRLGATEDPLVIVFYFAAVAVLGSIPDVALVGIAPTALEWLLLAAIGVATQLGQVLMTKGLRAERAGRATAVGYLQIVFAAVWGALFFHELPGLLAVFGAVLVVAGTLVLARSGASASRQPFRLFPTDRSGPDA